MKCSECFYCYKTDDDLFPCCHWDSDYEAPCEVEDDYEIDIGEYLPWTE